MRQLSTLSHGLFDPTVGTVKLNARQCPDASRDSLITQLQEAMGLSAWSLDGDCLVFNDRRTAFDLGGVVKAYAMNVAASLAAEQGVAKGSLTMAFCCPFFSIQ